MSLKVHHPINVSWLYNDWTAINISYWQNVMNILVSQKYQVASNCITKLINYQEVRTTAPWLRKSSIPLQAIVVLSGGEGCHKQGGCGCLIIWLPCVLYMWWIEEGWRHCTEPFNTTLRWHLSVKSQIREDRNWYFFVLLSILTVSFFSCLITTFGQESTSGITVLMR